MDTPALSGLARRIVQDKLLDAQAAGKASKQATQDKIPFITYLVQNKLANARDLAMLCAEEFGYPYCDLNAIDKDSQPQDLVSEKLIRQHSVLPLFKRGEAWEGAADPVRPNQSVGLKRRAVQHRPDDRCGDC